MEGVESGRTRVNWSCIRQKIGKMIWSCLGRGWAEEDEVAQHMIMQ